MDRRAFVLGACALGSGPFLPTAAAGAIGLTHALDRDFANIERRTGGRLGVAVVSFSRVLFEYRSSERFPMCSTFKLPLVACVLSRVDSGVERLDRTIAYTRDDLLSYAPVTRANVARGGLSVGELCAAAMEKSDNTAANLLLRSVGGPVGLTRYLRSTRDGYTRLDRNEPTLNTAIPGDPRDTTIPAAMAALLHDRILVPLTTLRPLHVPGSTQHLRRWMEAATTGASRLRAGFPRRWIVGDKTGTGDHGTANDVAFAIPGDRYSGLVIASYLTETTCSDAERDAAHADVARLVAANVGTP